jgi:hypothetical protein
MAMQITELCTSRDKNMDQVKHHFLEAQKDSSINSKQKHLIMATASLGEAAVQQQRIRQLIANMQLPNEDHEEQTASRVSRLLHLTEVLSEVNPTEDLVSTMTEFYCLSKNLPSAYVIVDNIETDVYVDTVTEVVVKDQD